MRVILLDIHDFSEYRYFQAKLYSVAVFMVYASVGRATGGIQYSSSFVYICMYYGLVGGATRHTVIVLSDSIAAAAAGREYQ